MRNPASTGVVEFVERNLLGRTLTSEPITASTDEEHTEATYADQTFFSNLAHRSDGFDLDLTVITLGRRFRLDTTGNRIELAGSMDAVRVYRYEMTERLSTGRLLGFARFVSSTNVAADPMAGTCFLVQMELDGDCLVVLERQVGYGDFPGPGGLRKPQALDSRYRYAVDGNGALSLEFDQETFDVDPQSFARSATGDRFPTQVSKEMVDREGEPVATG